MMTYYQLDRLLSQYQVRRDKGGLEYFLHSNGVWYSIADVAGRSNPQLFIVTKEFHPQLNYEIYNSNNEWVDLGKPNKNPYYFTLEEALAFIEMDRL